MAEEKKVSPLTSHVNANLVWKRKYLALKKHCQQLEEENECIVNRIYHVKKFLKQSRRHKRGLMQKLDEYNDDYQNAMPPIYSELLADICCESFPVVQSALFSHGNLDDSPGQTSNVGTSATKKNKGRSSNKAEKERDPNAPKKPSNAFFMFCQQQRTVMQGDQKESAMGHHELTKTLAKEWNNLVPEEKKVYYVMYEKDKARYEQEMKNYTPDKVEKTSKKEGSVKKQKKTAKLNEFTATEATVVSPPGCESSEIDPRVSLVVSPTLNPLSPQSLTAVPFNLPQIPSPTLPPLSDDPAFEDFDSTTDITRIF